MFCEQNFERSSRSSSIFTDVHIYYITFSMEFYYITVTTAFVISNKTCMILVKFQIKYAVHSYI